MSAWLGGLGGVGVGVLIGWLLGRRWQHRRKRSLTFTYESEASDDVTERRRR